jgi:hypothetical protein
MEGRRQEILSEMGTITHMRIGTLSEQRIKTRLADGSTKVNGPYSILTYKGAENKTVSESVGADRVDSVLEQVANRQRFMTLAKDYVEVCDEMTRANATVGCPIKKN